MSVHGLRARLTREDIQRLTDAADPEGRAMATRKLCTRIALDGFSEADRAAGEAVLSLLAEDAAEIVRRALAVTLQRSPHLPPAARSASLNPSSAMRVHSLRVAMARPSGSAASVRR